MSSNVSVSPFIVGPPVLDPARFHGRRREVTDFFAVLRAPQLVPVSVVGVARSGKTSYLRHVSNDAIAQTELLTLAQEGRPTIIAYADLGPVKELADLHERIVDAVRRSLPAQPASRAVNLVDKSSRSVDDFLSTVRAKSRLVILLDDFDTPSRFPWFADALQWLRSLVDERLVWVTATVHDIATGLCAQDVSSCASPFCGIFRPARIVLGALDEEDCIELICGEAATALLVVSREEALAIRGLAGGLPYFIQEAAGLWLKCRTNGCDSRSLVECVPATCLALRRSGVFDGVWRHLSTAQQSLLESAALQDVPARGEQMTGEEAQLVRLGLLEELAGVIRPPGRALRQWLVHRDRVREE